MSSEEFNSVWFPLADRFYRVAFYILESEAEAEDAVQDLFLKLWKRRFAIGNVENPLAFGLTMVKNICLDRIRSAARSRTVFPEPEILASMISTEESMDNGLIRRERLQRIRECMARLPDSQRKVLEMRVFENIPYPEIARRTGLSEINVRVKLSAARKKLKKMTSDEEY